jgi:diguanylate cyclase (GGDEF)-like protein
MTLICDRLEDLTECFSEIKVLDDSTGLFNRENFLKVLETEMQRSRRYHSDLALGLINFDFDSANPDLDHFEKERILRKLAESFSKEIRDCDILSRFGHQTFALLMPHSSTVDAQLLCNRLRTLFEEKCNAAEGMQIKLTVGIADCVRGADESGSAILARATVGLQKAEES